jgi:protein-disulfide isomerase
MKFLAPLAAILMLATPALAIDLEAMTDAERDAFRAEVRAYLLDNPDVLAEAFTILDERAATAEAARDQSVIVDQSAALYDSAFDWNAGNPDGDLVMVEFMDYRCGFCRRASPDIDQLIQTDGNIRLIVKEFPILGEQSVLASRFAIASRIALGDDAYAAIHDALMEMRGDMTEASLSNLATELGLDSTAILGSIDDPQVDATIAANYALAQQLNITGTPSFVFGGEMMRGYVPFDGMVEIAAQLRADAR